jgi:pimeloyl-ACP methyl ester carboxylesterase
MTLRTNAQSLWHFASRKVSFCGMLNTVKYDGPAGTPLLIAHGLFGSARNWGVIAKRLSALRPVICVDMRNHGQSPWSDSHSYADLADDLAKVMDKPMDVLGHSMGGKAAMVLALQNPDLVSRLIVADIAPVTYSHSQDGPIAAMRQVDLAQITSRGDAKDQLGPLEAGVADFLLQSLDMKDRKWRLNIDVLAAEMDKIIGFPDVGGAFAGPTLFLSGGNSDYVTRDARPLIKTYFPAAKFAKIPGAGHWLHAEKPREFEAAVTAFLAL